MLTQQKFPAGEIPLLEVNRGEKEEGLSPCLPGSERFHFESPPDGCAERHPCFIVGTVSVHDNFPLKPMWRRVAMLFKTLQISARIRWFHPTRSAGMKTQQSNDSCLCKCHIIYLSIYFSKYRLQRIHVCRWKRFIQNNILRSGNVIPSCALFKSVSKYAFSPINIILFPFQSSLATYIKTHAQTH